MFVAAYRNTEAGARRIAEQRRQITPRRDALTAASLKWAREQAEKEERARRAAQWRENQLVVIARAIPQPAPKTKEAVRRLIGQAGAWHGISVEEILGRSHQRPIVEARFDAIAAVRHNYPSMSLMWIGRVFNRDHTSIISALKRRGMK